MTYLNTIKLVATSAVAFLAAASSTLASPARATTDVNVRSGPGSSFAILDTLNRGERVDVVECVSSGWCRVTQSGPSGWVYSRYLNEGASSPASPAPSGATRACFFTGQNYTGESFCIGAGQADNLPSRFDDNISSYQISPGASVRFCVFPNMAGQCYDGSRTTPTLGAAIDNRASSLRVRAGVAPSGGTSGGSSGGSAGAGSSSGSGRPDCSFALVVGPDGPKWTFTCGPNPVVPGSGAGAPPPPPPPAPPSPSPVRNEACFYTDVDFGGEEFCSGPGVIDMLNRPFKGTISSVRLFGTAHARLWTNDFRRGTLYEVRHTTPRLSRDIADRAYSAQVLGTRLSIANVNSGSIAMLQTFTADVDHGIDGNDPSLATKADLFFHAVSDREKYIAPANRASLSFIDGSRRGFAGCANAYYDSSEVPLSALHTGDHICVSTGEGRYSEIVFEGTRGIAGRGDVAKFTFRTWDMN